LNSNNLLKFIKKLTTKEADKMLKDIQEDKNRKDVIEFPSRGKLKNLKEVINFDF